MSSESGTNRWWENYLVRYLMPSIAGMVIVNWITLQAGELRLRLLLPETESSLSPASLTLLFLYGNLFCYVASYPILVFHATRVTDFRDGNWRARPWYDGYLSVLTIMVVAFVVFHYGSAAHHFYAAFLMTAAFAAIQCVRLFCAISPRIRVSHLGEVSPAFGFAYSLARRRGLTDVTEKTATTTREIAWRQDFVATYRHLREHGNSAFIFLHELLLAVLVYFVISKPHQSVAQQLGAIGGLLALWAVPAVFVHFLGQHLERRFAHFERRIDTRAPAPTVPARRRPVWRQE